MTNPTSPAGWPPVASLPPVVPPPVHAPAIQISKRTVDDGGNPYRLPLPLKTFVFNGGEVSVKLDATHYRYRDTVSNHLITARIQSSVDFMTLVMTVDALRRWDDRPIDLFLPYLSYGRQDRVCDAGESFSLKVFGQMLNALEVRSVITLDPHSAVTEAAVNRLTAISQCKVVQRWDELTNRLRNVQLVSPDAGANKKTSEIAGYLGHGSFVRADKLRDLTNGRIKEVVVYADDLSGSDVAICDDLTDKGGTFIGLAQVLKAKGARRVLLYTTHSILPDGPDALFAGGIDEIWTTNSFRTDLDARIKVLDVGVFAP